MRGKFGATGVLILAGVLVYLLWPNGEESEKAESSTTSAKSAGVSAPIIFRMNPGAIRIDGRPDEWREAKVPAYTARARVSGPGARLAKLTADRARLRGVAFAHDEANLFILFKLAGGVAKHLEQTGATGALGYLYLDADGEADTGQLREVAGTKMGAECRIWLPTGFHGGTGKPIRPMIAYKVQTYDGQGYEEQPEGVKTSHENPGFIAFDDPFVEARIPLKVLGLSPPAKVSLYMDHMGLAGDGPLLRLRLE